MADWFIDFLLIVILPVIVLAITAFGYVYGVRKKKIEAVLQELAEKSGLKYDKRRVRYSFVRGDYKGYEVEVGVYNGYSLGKGLIGFSLTGHGSMAAMGISNFSAIKLKHGKKIKDKKRKGNVIITSDELILNYPVVLDNASTLRNGLDKLVKIARKLGK